MPLSITERARIVAALLRRVMRTLNVACNARLQFGQAGFVLDCRSEQISLCLEDRLLSVGHVLVGGLAESKPCLGDLQLALRLLDAHGERLHPLEVRAELDDGRPDLQLDLPPRLRELQLETRMLELRTGQSRPRGPVAERIREDQARLPHVASEIQRVADRRP